MGSSTFSLALILLAGMAGVAGAQEPPEVTNPLVDQRVVGRIVRPGDRRMLPVPGVWVILHRVGSETAAPLDSLRSNSNGEYSFTYRRTGDAQAIYFVSASYSGIAYFTPPFHHALVRGEEAEIAVFDTTSSRVPTSVRGRHVIVSAVDANAVRSVTEVYELANDSSVTRVAANTTPAGAVWTTMFPTGARNFRATPGQGDVPADAITFADGKAAVFAPLAPGLKQVAFTYDVPASSFPLSVPITRATEVYEVLIEEPTGTVTGANLKEVDPVNMEKRMFRRFLASNIPANAVSVIDLPAATAGRVDGRYLVGLTVLIGGSMVFALARALRKT